MSFVPLSLVVFASLLHASWNLLAKREASGGWVFVFSYDLFSGLAYLPWVAWIVAHGDARLGSVAAACILSSGLVHLGYSLCLQRGYQVADLSVVYPVARGAGPVLSSVGAFILLREAPTAEGLSGLAAVVVGIGLISTQGDLSAFRRPGGQAGVRWGVATGALIAAYTVVDAYAVKALALQPVVLSFGSNLLQVVVLAPLVARRQGAVRERMRGRWRAAAMVGLLSPMAYILVLTALGMGAPLSVVAPAREMSMMVGALMGMAVLHEPVGRWRLAGCLMLVLGVVLLGGS